MIRYDIQDWDYDLLKNIVSEHGTPLYVTDINRVLNNIKRLSENFNKDTGFLYAMKANSSKSVLKHVIPEIDGVECGSIGEIKRVVDAVENTTTIHYTMTNQSDKNLKEFIKIINNKNNHNYIANLNDIGTLDRLISFGYEGDICIRINPGIGVGHHEKVATGKDVKFGILQDDIDEAVKNVKESKCSLVGIHAHSGSGVLQEDIDDYIKAIKKIMSIAENLDVNFVDIGGGLGVPYKPEDKPLNLEEVSKRIYNLKEKIIPNKQLKLEPGRFMTADSGILLTKVNTIKKTPKVNIVGVDSGMTTLIRPAMYDSYHPADILTDEEREKVTTTLAGPICESSDVFFVEREFPKCKRKDIVIIGNTGAYGYDMASVFHSQPRPKTIILKENKTKIERKRETIKEITKLETGKTFN